MIDRYSTAETEAIFSETGKMARWLEVELSVVEALAEVGLVPVEAAVACRRGAPVIDGAFVARVEAREQVTNHDVAAFVDVLQESIGGPHATWVHYGLTSTDVVDTALCWALRDVCGHIDASLGRLLEVVLQLAEDHATTAMIGRTHGVHAEPTTFGAKLALFGLQLVRDRERMRRASVAVSVCKLSGAVGTYSNIPPSVEDMVAKRLGLVAVPATQVIARDRHAEFLYACASIGTTLETIAVELRHLQRTEVNEVREGFAAGQKGSSAMPHKRNPISAETITGLSRVLRGNLQVGLQDVPLWHERDISHSSAERIVLPDSSALTLYMIRRMTSLLSSLEIDVDQMTRNLDALHGVVFSQSVLLAMISCGMERDAAYRLVQSAAREAMGDGREFKDVLASLTASPLSQEQLDAAFDPARVLKNSNLSIDALRSAINSAG